MQRIKLKLMSFIYSEFDMCVNVTCNHHGDCINERTSYYCDCHDGFEGVFCDIGIYLN